MFFKPHMVWKAPWAEEKRDKPAKLFPTKCSKFYHLIPQTWLKMKSCWCEDSSADVVFLLKRQPAVSSKWDEPQVCSRLAASLPTNDEHFYFGHSLRVSFFLPSTIFTPRDLVSRNQMGSVKHTLESYIWSHLNSFMICLIIIFIQACCFQ